MAKYRGTRLGRFRAYIFGWGICLTGFLFGFDTGIVGGVLTMKSYENDFRYTDSTTVSAVMVSLQNVGAFLSAISIWYVNERLGRKKTIQAACCVFITGVILQVCPTGSLVAFYIGRFVAGLGLGSMTAVSPGYNAEMAPKEIRAKLGSGMQWMFGLGVMLSYWIVYGTSHMKDSAAQWQIPVGLQILPPAILGLGLLTQKESVRWLIGKDRLEEAYDNLKWHRADDGPEVKAEFEEMKTGVAQEKKASQGFKKRELLEPANRYRLILGFGLFLGQQCTGMTALAYFAPQIFGVLVGTDQSTDLLITGLFGAQKFVACGLYILLVSERWGRRPTFWIAPLFMATLFIIVCIVNQTTTNSAGVINYGAGVGTCVLIFLTNSIYQFSWGPLPWAYTAEIFPTRIREIGTSVSVSTQWLFNFLFSLTTPYMVAAMGSYVFLFYAVLDLIMAFLAFLFVKETKGRSIEEMETIFHSKAAFDVNIARRRGASLTEEALEQRIENVDSEEETTHKTKDIEA